jgi:hypothetical protein
MNLFRSVNKMKIFELRQLNESIRVQLRERGDVTLYANESKRTKMAELSLFANLSTLRVTLEFGQVWPPLWAQLCLLLRRQAMSDDEIIFGSSNFVVVSQLRRRNQGKTTATQALADQFAF